MSPCLFTERDILAELRRLVDLLDGPCTMPDGSNADTSRAHAILGDFAPEPDADEDCDRSAR